MKFGADELLGGMGNLFSTTVSGLQMSTFRVSSKYKRLHQPGVCKTPLSSTLCSEGFLSPSVSLLPSPPQLQPCAILGQICGGSQGENKENVRGDKRINLHHSLLLSLRTSHMACCGEGREASYHTYKVLRGLAPELSNGMEWNCLNGLIPSGTLPSSARASAQCGLDDPLTS